MNKSVVHYINHKQVACDLNRVIYQRKYLKKGDTCAICLDDVFSKRVKHTPCGHIFCCNCLTKWQTMKKRGQKCKCEATCPTCRSKLANKTCSQCLLQRYIIYRLEGGEDDSEDDSEYVSDNEFEDSDEQREFYLSNIRNRIRNFITRTRTRMNPDSDSNSH